jgi:hypothetical protein
MRASPQVVIIEEQSMHTPLQTQLMRANPCATMQLSLLYACNDSQLTIDCNQSASLLVPFDLPNATP